jgi:excisionase family DNA binding protein
MTNRWLTIPEAAPQLGVSEATLRTWCKAHKIEHKREGTRGRGGHGTILIEQAVIEAHNAEQRVVTLAPPRVDSFLVSRKRIRFVSPHLEPEKFALA